jgi:hypothetical protein
MGTLLRASVSAVALMSVVGLAAAQQAPAGPQDKGNLATPQQKQEQEKAQHSEPGRAGTTEPSSETPTSEPQDTAAFVNGRLAVPGAPADSQTVPAKFSERNAALDRLPTMAFPLPLTDEQKARIRETLSKSNAPLANVRLHAADQVPSSVALSELPQSLVTEIPVVAGYEYVRTPDGILLVRTPGMTVVGEITK